MVDKIIGIKENYFVVEGNCGAQFKEELNRLKKLYPNKRIVGKIVTKAIIIMEDK